MVLTDYILGHFARSVLGLSLFLAFFILTAQFFSGLYLLFVLPPLQALGYVFLMVVYTLLIAMALSLPLAASNLIYTFKERRIFHTLYTFGVSEKAVLRRVWLALLMFSIAGAAASLFVNYQKISHLTKYLKFKFSEKALLTVPSGSFANFENLSVYFESKKGTELRNVVVKMGEDVAVAKRAELLPGGLLLLEDSVIFAREGGYLLFMESARYTVNIVDKYSYKPPRRKFLRETVFTVSLFLLPSIFFPFLFYAVLRRAEGRFKALLFGSGLMLVQFIVALILKALV